jgi:hypothetical protein
MRANTMTTALRAESNLNRIHALLTVQTLAIVLGSINRLGPWTLGYVAANEFLRWVDLVNMLIIPLISLLALYLVKKQLESNGDAVSINSRRHLALNLIFIVGLYLLGASYGDHEVTNYLHARFCADDTSSALCRIVIFNDDEFSHWVFFTGFVMVNAALMFFQVLFPRRGRLSTLDVALLALNALFIGAGIFANLAFEVIGLDLVVVALLTAVALWLWWRNRSQPLIVYYSIAYTLGLLATTIYKIVNA